MHPGPREKWGEAAALETLLGPCFPRAFVTKDILFQTPAPHLRSSSLSVKRQSHSFHPCRPGWRCVGQGALAWQRDGCPGLGGSASYRNQPPRAHTALHAWPYAGGSSHQLRHGALVTALAGGLASSPRV